MKFSIGDKILLKRTGEEGSVVAFLSKTMMEVEVSGIHFPVYNEEVDHPYLKWFTEKKKQEAKRPVEFSPENPEKRAARLPQGIYLSFIPQFAALHLEDVIESFGVHFINETADHLLYQYEIRAAASGVLSFRHKALIHPYGNVFLHTISLEEINEQPRFHWFAAINNHPEGVSGTVRLRPAQLVRHIRRMLDENLPSFSILLHTDAAPIGAEKETAISEKLPAIAMSSFKDSSPQRVLYSLPEAVVDLHINSIVKERQNLAPDEILQIQLRFLEQKVEAALAANLDKMIVIHGIGKGRLKQKAHELLAGYREVLRFSNYWMGGYGWGATEVIFEDR